MARLTTCPDCAAPVSRKAASCPRCGCPLRKMAKQYSCLSGCFTLGLLVFVLAVLVRLLSPVGQNHPPEEPSNNAAFASTVMLARIEETFQKRGMPITTRQAIFRALCFAELRAQWEANRLYPMRDHLQENTRYHDEMTPKYEKVVYDEYHLTKADADLIDTEAHIREWPLPVNSPYFLAEMARGMNVEVYANRGDYTYHRKACPFLDKARPIVSLSLYKAISNQEGKPCAYCAP